MKWLISVQFFFYQNKELYHKDNFSNSSKLYLFREPSLQEQNIRERTLYWLPLLTVELSKQSSTTYLLSLS